MIEKEVFVYEHKVRYFSTIIISIQMIWTFWIVWCPMYELEGHDLIIQGNMPSLRLIIALSVFFAFGILILLSIYFRYMYHIMAMLEVVFFVWLYSQLYGYRFETSIRLFFVVLPHIIYYILRIKAAIQMKR